MMKEQNKSCYSECRHCGMAVPVSFYNGSWFVLGHHKTNGLSCSGAGTKPAFIPFIANSKQ